MKIMIVEAMVLIKEIKIMMVMVMMVAIINM